MKNILTILALMMGTAVALNAQTIEVLQVNTSIGVYTVATPNANGNQVDFQLLLPDGNVWANCQYHNIQNRLTIDYVEGDCNVDAAGYTDATGEFTFKPDADAVDVLGMDLCYSLDGDTEPALYGDVVVRFFNYYVDENFGIEVTDVVGDQIHFNMYYGETEDTFWWNAVYHVNSDMFTGPWVQYYFWTNQGDGLYFNYNNYGEGFEVTPEVVAYFQSLIPVCPVDLSDELTACETATDSLQALLDEANAIIDNLSTENADLAADLYECEDYTAWADQTIANLQANAVTTGELLAAWQAFALEQQHATMACESLTDSLYAELDTLSTELASCQIANEDCFNNYGELSDVLNDTLEFYNEVIIGAGTTINELNAEVEDLEDQLADALAESDTCFQEYSALDDQFIDAVFAYEAYIDSLNAIISAVPATIQAIVDPLNAELEAAQECCSSCPAAIETAVDNALEYAYEDCNEHLMQVANANQAMGYESGYADGVVACEEANAGELMEVYYNGYAAGLEDCADSVDGITDIDGSLINVIGYYNELGQVIDPRTATGVIIRKHDDGTFSKYIQRLQ